jgi:hypothetical protein
VKWDNFIVNMANTHSETIPANPVVVVQDIE